MPKPHSHNPTHPRRPQRRGFTLTELLVVIGIIVLMIALAVPLLRVLSGSRSQTAAANQIAGLLGEARLKALSVQRPVGVFFYHDPASDRYTGVIVEEDANPDPDVLLLEVFPDANPQQLTVGVGAQFLNGPNPDAPGADYDRYLSRGLILFDSRGQLITQQFGIVWDSELGNLLGLEKDKNFPTSASPAIFSQFGFGLFDRPAFMGLGYSDDDPPYDGGDTTKERKEEESWLNQNTLPFTINRYTGTLIKAE